ncbi:venom acid phosphatase Acph-1-like isoform X2 [Atheta coriaria]
MSRSNKSNNIDQSTLVLTQVIFRHGHRSPDQKLNYPGDPYELEPYLPYGRGELTLIGRKQCFAFGQTLRNRYSKFLGPDYVNGLVEAKSSEISRARTTLQLVLAGLFPPSSTSKIHDTLNWQPVPFTYKPLKEDALIGRAIVNMYQHEDHPEFRKTANSQEVIKCIEEDLKWNVRVQAQCLLLFDTLKTQIGVGLEMPKWCVEIFPNKLKKEFEDFTKHNFARKDFIIGGFGEFIKEINNIMTQKVEEITRNGEKLPKIFLYSGHDINIAGILSIFKQFDSTKWPNYMSNITFELHKIDGEFYVKILHQNGPEDAKNLSNEEKLNILKLPNSNEEMCKLSEFTKHVQEYFPTATKL